MLILKVTLPAVQAIPLLHGGQVHAVKKIPQLTRQCPLPSLSHHISILSITTVMGLITSGLTSCSQLQHLVFPGTKNTHIWELCLGNTTSIFLYCLCVLTLVSGHMALLPFPAFPSDSSFSTNPQHSAYPRTCKHASGFHILLLPDMC